MFYVLLVSKRELFYQFTISLCFPFKALGDMISDVAHRTSVISECQPYDIEVLLHSDYGIIPLVPSIHYNGGRLENMLPRMGICVVGSCLIYLILDHLTINNTILLIRLCQLERCFGFASTPQSTMLKRNLVIASQYIFIFTELVII